MADWAIPLVGPDAYTDEWYALRIFDPDRKDRPVVFGASEASMAIENPLELYMYKRQLKPPREATEEMEVGSLMEPVVMQLYERREGYTPDYPVPLYFHGEHSFMAATPDGIVYDGEKSWGVDAKTTSSRMLQKHEDDFDKYGDEGTDAVPRYVLWQMQQQCAVLNFPFVDVPVLVGRHYQRYRVERDETLIQILIKAEKELAERIIHGDPPEPSWRAEGTRQCLRELYGHEPGQSTTLSHESYSRWIDVARRKQQIKELDADNREDINKIMAEIGSCETAAFPQGGKELKRTIIQDTFYTEKDAAAVVGKIGQIRRKGHERLTERTVQ